MSNILYKILKEEISVFKYFSKYYYLSDNAIAFINQTPRNIPHWNSIYPLTENYIYTLEELEKANNIYSDNGKEGYVILIGNKWASKSIDSIEYYFIDRSDDYNNMNYNKYNVIKTKDVELFCSVFQEGYHYNNISFDYFKKKMKVFAERDGSQFWIIYDKHEPCGCCSVFQTINKHYFLFNICVIEKWRNRNMCSEMISKIAKYSKKPLYSLTQNPIMQYKVFPRSGFKSAGYVHRLRICDYITKVYK